MRQSRFHGTICLELATPGGTVHQFSTIQGGILIAGQDLSRYTYLSQYVSIRAISVYGGQMMHRYM